MYNTDLKLICQNPLQKGTQCSAKWSLAFSDWKIILDLSFLTANLFVGFLLCVSYVTICSLSPLSSLLLLPLITPLSLV